MVFNWQSPLFVRSIILVVTSTVLGLILDNYNQNFLSFILSIGFIMAVVIQVSELIKNVEKHQDSSSDLDAKSSTDGDVEASSKKETSPEFFLLKSKEREERNSEYQFFKNIVQHVGIGIITFKNDGTIQLINNAAKKLLQIERAEKLADLREVSEHLVETYLKLKTGGRELVHLKNGDETVQLSVYAIELILRGEVVKLISMSNIQNELEEKEMEAWQNLIRVLTHEIMNSVTPISSLAKFLEDELQRKLLNDELNILKEEAEDMHLSAQTISKRSEGLIKFVKEFRSLTHIPQPNLADVSIKELLEEIAFLHKKELVDNDISILINVNPEIIKVNVDKTLIEQVLINLIKNAIQSFGEKSEKRIILNAYVNEKKDVFVIVKDNGMGIVSEALEKIFIPFFSTKKNGSGIGLSISKQIMRKHKGNIFVKSTFGIGTEFILRFGK